MTIEIKQVSEINEEELQQKEDFLRQFFADAFPDIDTTTGSVLNARVLRPLSLLHVIASDNFTRLQQSQSLRLVEQDPTLAEPDVVDNIASNFLIERTPGTKATGRTVIVLSTKVTTVIASGSVFISEDRRFVTTQPFTGVTDEGLVLTGTDRLIQDRADGTFSFIVDVIAEAEGEASRLPQGAALDLQDPPTNYVSSFASEDFSGGTDEQSNQDLIDQLSVGVSTQVLAGRNNIESLLISNFPGITHTSLVGFGDAEMTRDRNNIFAISHGGKSDIQLASDVRPTTTVVVKEAVLIDETQQILQINFTKDENPGFYTITRVVREGSTVGGSLEIVSIIRGSDLTGEGFIPEIFDNTQAAFTAFQTVELRFKDPAFDPSAGTTESYEISILGMPDIAGLQDFVSNRDRRNPNADYLIKAAVPLLTGVSLRISKLASELSDGDAIAILTSNIQEEVARRVNAVGFALGQLPVSLVIAAASSLLTGQASVATPVELTASLLRPTGEVQNFFDTDKILIPNDPELGVSQRTALFFLDPQNVEISFEDIGVVEV